MVVFQPLAGG
ncbi:hypothetical protein YPPY94_1317, partial [Yersinia pestis PY-94]